MRVSIERKRPTVKKLFGGTKEADHESAFVTIEFSPDEIHALKSNKLTTRIVYEHPQDEIDYEEGQRIAAEHPNSYAGQHPPPRFKRSRFVSHFLEQPTQEVYAYLNSPIQFAQIQEAVGNNLREIKQLIENVNSYPTDKATFTI